VKVTCPACAALVRAAAIQLDKGWAVCEACDEVFPLSRALPGFPAPAAGAGPERPWNARAVVEESPDGLVVYVPAEGMRAGTWGALGFTLFWLGFVAFWTVGALGLWGGQPGGGLNWVFASFSLPFWVAGVWGLAGVLWKAWGAHAVYLDEAGLLAQYRCLGWARATRVERAKVQRARPYDAPAQNNGARAYGAEIVYEKGSFVVPADSQDEEGWLVHRINDYLKRSTA
jgi:hypothetical protein